MFVRCCPKSENQCGKRLLKKSFPFTLQPKSTSRSPDQRGLLRFVMCFSVFDISFPVSPKAFWETASLTITFTPSFSALSDTAIRQAEQNSFFHLGNIFKRSLFHRQISTACTKNCIRVVASLELISPSPSQSIADFCTSFTSTLPSRFTSRTAEYHRPNR